MVKVDQPSGRLIVNSIKRDTDISGVPYKRDVRNHPQPVLYVSLVILIILHLIVFSCTCHHVEGQRPHVMHPHVE